MTSSAAVAPFAEHAEPARPLADLREGAAAVVTSVVASVSGDDPLAQRLVASGFWAGAHVECIGKAPFGDPMLFRVHGYRLALRRSEAARVLVREART